MTEPGQFLQSITRLRHGQCNFFVDRIAHSIFRFNTDPTVFKMFIFLDFGIGFGAKVK